MDDRVCRPEPSPWEGLWSLDPGCLFLNHGSFGACPRPILEEQRLLRDAMERQPVDFLDRELDERLAVAREALAAVPFPAAPAAAPAARRDARELRSWVRERGIESWFTAWPCPGGKLVRVSAQIYNTESQFHALARALEDALHAP
jgi:hypothetical protein